MKTVTTKVDFGGGGEATSPEILPPVAASEFVKKISSLAPAATRVRARAGIFDGGIDLYAILIVLIVSGLILMLLSSWAKFPITGLIAIIGYFGIAGCRLAHSRHELMSNGHRTRIDRLVPGEKANVKGRIVAARQLLTSPLWYQHCVYCLSHVTDVVESQDSDTGDHTETTFLNVQAVECVVDDGTGQAIVDIRDAKIFPYGSNTNRPSPDPVPELAGSKGRKYSEQVIQEGDSVIVVGVVWPDPGDVLPRLTRGRDLIVSQTGALGIKKQVEGYDLFVWCWGGVITIIIIVDWLF